MLLSDSISVVSIPETISETDRFLLLYDMSNVVKPYNIQYVDIDLKRDQLQFCRFM